MYKLNACLDLGPNGGRVSSLDAVAALFLMPTRLPGCRAPDGANHMKFPSPPHRRALPPSCPATICAAARYTDSHLPLPARRRHSLPLHSLTTAACKALVAPDGLNVLNTGVAWESPHRLLHGLASIEHLHGTASPQSKACIGWPRRAAPPPATAKVCTTTSICFTVFRMALYLILLTKL